MTPSSRQLYNGPYVISELIFFFLLASLVRSSFPSKSEGGKGERRVRSVKRQVPFDHASEAFYPRCHRSFVSEPSRPAAPLCVAQRPTIWVQQGIERIMLSSKIDRQDATLVPRSPIRFHAVGSWEGGVDWSTYSEIGCIPDLKYWAYMASRRTGGGLDLFIQRHHYRPSHV